MKKLLVAFTDGSCMNNGKVGAKGGMGIHFPNHELPDISQPYSSNIPNIDTATPTNQRTELTAILLCLRYVNKELGLNNYELLIKTDSKYSINCITQWAQNWSKNNWTTANGKSVMNKDLIMIIYKYYTKFDINFQYVKAHTTRDDEDSNGNRIADKLATSASLKQIK